MSPYINKLFYSQLWTYNNTNQTKTKFTNNELSL